MKDRLYVLGFATLLLVGAWGKAYAQPSSAGPAAVPNAMVVTPDAAPSCSASSVNGIQGLDLTPNPSLKAITCGSCSQAPSQGMAANSACYYLAGGTYHLAKCVINSWCSEDSRPYCDCTNNPPQ